ncbi:GNAT family N-acetyltransferase [Calditrichota bacterium]
MSVFTMIDSKLISDYREDENFRSSFNRLTDLVFGFNLEDWYLKGFWDDRYIPYSFVKNSEIIANVSVSRMDMILNGVKRKAVQIGTVMTHPDYRGMDLSAGLMNHVINKYDSECDLMFLFANSDTFDFYPRFGFKRQVEHQFFLNTDKIPRGNSKLVKLDISKPASLQMLYRIAVNRKPVSNVFAAENAHNLLMYHCMYIFNNDIYYHEETDSILIFRNDHDTLHVFDIINSSQVNFIMLAGLMVDTITRRILLHFTPDILNLDISPKKVEMEDALFFLAASFGFNYPFYRQKTCEA